MILSSKHYDIDSIDQHMEEQRKKKTMKGIKQKSSYAVNGGKQSKQVGEEKVGDNTYSYMFSMNSMIQVNVITSLLFY